MASLLPSSEDQPGLEHSQIGDSSGVEDKSDSMEYVVKEDSMPVLARCTSPSSSPETQVLGNEDLLRQILLRVSRGCGGYHHALVCRRWHELSAPLQSVVFVSRQRKHREVDLLKELRNFPSLTDIRLPGYALLSVSDFFLGAVSFLFPGLLHFDIENFAAERDNITSSGGLGPLFASSPQLKTLKYNSVFDMGEDDDLVDRIRVPETLTILTRLTELHFSRCASLPARIGNLRSLRHLFLNGHPLTHLPESVTQLSRLTCLHLDTLQLYVLPEALGNLSSLRKLTIHTCCLLRFPRSLTRLRRLKEIEVGYCDYLEEIPEDLRGLTSLTTLRLLSCSSLREVPASLCHLTALEDVAITCSGLGRLQGSWGNLVQLKSLRLAELEELPQGLGKLKQLTKLRISCCPSLRKLPPELGSLESLRVLHLFKMEGLSSIPQTFTGLTNLEEVDVGTCVNLKFAPRDFLQLPKLTLTSRLELHAVFPMD